MLKADKVCLFTKIIKQKKTKNHTHETYYIGDFFFSFLLTHGVQVTKGLIGPFHSVAMLLSVRDAQYQTIPNKSHLNQSVKSKTLLFFTMKPIQICPLLSKSQIGESQGKCIKEISVFFCFCLFFVFLRLNIGICVFYKLLTLLFLPTPSNSPRTLQLKEMQLQTQLSYIPA